MRFTSLIVELVRARPKLVAWLVTLIAAGIWLIVPLLLYSSAPGDVADVLAFGREYVLGTDLGPPLAFWLADIAFRFAGNHMIGVYLLSQLCFVLAFWTLFRLGQLIVGPQQSALAVVLTATITAFSFPNVEFGPYVLAEPLWALVLLNAWRVIGLGKRDAWFALSMNVGLLLLTTHAGFLLLALLIGFAVATERGRKSLSSFDPVFALIVIVVMLAPYLVFLARADLFSPARLASLHDWQGMLGRWPRLFGGLLFALLGVVVLALANSSRLTSDPDQAPVIYRPPVDPLARQFVFYFTLAPAIVGSLISAIFGLDDVFGGTGTTLLMVGLATIVLAGDLIYLRRQRMLRVIWTWIIIAPVLFLLGLTFVEPWVGGAEVKTMMPASEIGEFFGDSYFRRTGQPLTAVAGDPELAALIGYSASRRPHLLLDETPDRTPWLTIARFNEAGGLVVWRAADTSGTPPEDIARHFPGLVPEVPRSFTRYLNGRQPLLRIGWGIIRPKATASSQ
jgi:dolichyl-phosphate-mannose-protein mannosyltransferase